MDCVALLEKLVGFPSVVGTPNHAIAGWIADYARAQGAAVHTLPGPEGDRANLFITLGPVEERGYVLSGHMDVVRADEPEWTSNPFALRADGERLYGRGTSDMKGFLAASLALLPKLAGRRLKRPLHLAFSYDEEAGCRGVPHLLAQLPALCQMPLGAIIGEPSGLQPILAHKGKAAARLTVIGRSGHSSRPDLALNAIHGISRVLSTCLSVSAALEEGPFDASFAPACSTLQVGVISGGQAVNIIPAEARIELEVRAIAGQSPRQLLEPVERAAQALTAAGYGVEWQLVSEYPALALPAGSALAGLAREISGQEPLAAVSYGTEAGLYQQAGMEAIICGPGDIARAHKPDEFIARRELAACETMLERLAAQLS
ncbi:acetylornithine deacetylase [Allorhizobium undicola]|uniref:acetylornithine deacetylase n=1 Tax=Allorhizobium undicola TaxID=78527 RepID=UPI003D3478B1